MACAIDDDLANLIVRKKVNDLAAKSRYRVSLVGCGDNFDALVTAEVSCRHN